MDCAIGGESSDIDGVVGGMVDGVVGRTKSVPSE